MNIGWNQSQSNHNKTQQNICYVHNLVMYLCSQTEQDTLVHLIIINVDTKLLATLYQEPLSGTLPMYINETIKTEIWIKLC